MSNSNLSETEFIANDETETEELANLLAQCVIGGTYICLTGNLGAGKTTFTRSFAERLGVKEQITSPTFVLQKIYEIPTGNSITNFVHYDAYRLHSFEELLDLGIEDHPLSSIIVIEWGEKYFSYLPNPKLQITLNRLDENRRNFIFQGLSENQITFIKSKYKV